MDGQVTRYMVANGMTQFNENVNYDDVSPYSDFDGNSISDSEFAGEGDLIDFSDASGRRKKKKKGGSTMKSRMATRQKARADRKERKLKIKCKTVDCARPVKHGLVLRCCCSRLGLLRVPLQTAGLTSSGGRFAQWPTSDHLNDFEPTWQTKCPDHF